MAIFKRLKSIKNKKKMKTITERVKYVPENANVLEETLVVGDVLKIYGTKARITHIMKNTIPGSNNNPDFIFYTISFDIWGRAWYDITRDRHGNDIDIVEYNNVC
jgi:hypothetical protein